MASRALQQADYQRLAEFRYHLRQFIRFSELAAAEAGLNAQQHQALLAIKGTAGGHVTIAMLAERLAIRHNSAVELVNRLIANGLVKRQENPEDRREVLLELTPRADRTLEKLSLAHRNEIKKISPLLRNLLAEFGDGRHKSAAKKT